MANFTAVAAALLFPTMLCACGAPPVTADPNEAAEIRDRNDPIEPTNRKFFAVNDALDRNVLRPVATGYRSALPASVRALVHNTLSNLNNPAQFANDVLQAKPRKAAVTLLRLVINTTFGVAGIFDVASGWGFPDHDNDFGLTLAVWGVPEGPFLFLPVLGPTNPRDAIGYGINSALDPLTWISFAGSATVGVTRFGVGAVDGRARVLGATDTIDKTALDRYATYRSLSRQHRAAAVGAAKLDLPATMAGPFRLPEAATAAP